jgi:hypothetical protein
MNETNFQRPDWFFYPGWVFANILAITLSWFAYFLIIGVVTRWIGHTIQVNGQTRITEDFLFFYIAFPMFCFLSSFFQYSLLRLYVPKMGGWIWATMAGCLMVFLMIPFLQWIFESTFLTLWSGALAFAAIGGTIGLCQWIFLRQRIPKAGWWILASLLGWGLAVLGSLTPVRNSSALAQLLTAILSPAIVASFAWWYLLKPKNMSGNSVK